MQSNQIRWRSPIRLANGTGLLLVVSLGTCFTIMRALGTLGPQQLRPLLPLSFILMAAAPWALLRREGRVQIGIRPSTSRMAYVWAALCGASMALLCGLVGWYLFRTGPDNWYMTIARTYEQAFDTSGKSPVFLFLVFTFIAVAFSPIGEEMFFRALLQRSLEEKFSSIVCTHLECGAFAVVHLCHHGLYWNGQDLNLRFLSGFIWIMLMFGTAHLFAYFRKSTGSVFSAIVCHMAFNAVMNAFVFSVLWNAWES